MKKLIWKPKGQPFGRDCWAMRFIENGYEKYRILAMNKKDVVVTLTVEQYKHLKDEGIIMETLKNDTE